MSAQDPDLMGTVPGDGSISSPPAAACPFRWSIPRLRFDRLSTISKRGVAVAGGVGTVLSLLFLLWPQLRPEPAASTFAATLEMRTLDQAVSLRQYLRDYATGRALKMSEPPTEPMLNRLGDVAKVKVTITGHADAASTLQWSVWSIAEGQPSAPLPGLNDTWRLTPRGTSDQGLAEMWVPRPLTPGRYVIRIDLFGPTGLPLETVDSEAYEVTLPMPQTDRLPLSPPHLTPVPD